MSFPPPTDPQVTPTLNALAISFRDPTTRQGYAAQNTEFIPWLASVVRHVQEGDADATALYKLVANFVADDDTNRRIITSDTQFIALLRTQLDAPPPDEILKPLLASILNLLLSTDYLVPHAQLLGSWIALVRLGNSLHLPADPSPSSTTAEEVQQRATLASWAWSSALRLLESATASTPPSEIPLAQDIIPHLFSPFLHFSGGAERSPGTMHQDLAILASSAEVVGLLVDDQAWSGALGREVERGEGFVRFIEDGEVVQGWEDEEDSDSDFDDEEDKKGEMRKQADERPGEKSLGRIKAQLMGSLASLCATPTIHLFPSAGPTPLGQVLLQWLTDQTRDDLVSCGLLCIGNYITDGTLPPPLSPLKKLTRTDARAEEITSQPASITHLIRLLDSSDDKTPAQQTHALFGLLRNLVLAPAAAGLKRDLAGRVVGCVRRVRVLEPGGDLVGSLQGVAVGLMRLLCRGDGASASSPVLSPADTSRCVADSSRLIFGDEVVRGQIMDLWNRTDEQSIKIEIGRFVACLCTTLARTSQSADEQPALETLARDGRTVSALFALVRLGTQQEVLLAEGVLALALIAKTPGGARAVLDVLAPDLAPLESLETYAASSTAPAPILSNVCVMLLHLAQGRQNKEGTSASDDNDNDDDGNDGNGQVAARVERTLAAISARGDVDETVKGAVATALAVWR